MGSIGGIGGNSAILSTQGMHGMSRRDPAQFAAKLFSQLDTKGTGYIEKGDLSDAVGGAAGSDELDLDALFSQLDSDSDGKVSGQEFSDTLSKLADQLNAGFENMRMHAGMQDMGAMPPPPPPGDEGLSKDELGARLDEIGTTDSKAASLISNALENFDEADTNQDGKVSFAEAMALQQRDDSGQAGTSSSTTAQTEDSDAIVRTLRLLQAYMVDGRDGRSGSVVSVSA